MQGERNTKQNAKLLLLFPSRSLSWAKPKSARRAEYKTKCEAFVIIPEPKPILGEAEITLRARKFALWV